jgi:hypothetical protein
LSASIEVQKTIDRAPPQMKIAFGPVLSMIAAATIGPIRKDPKLSTLLTGPISSLGTCFWTTDSHSVFAGEAGAQLDRRTTEGEDLKGKGNLVDGVAQHRHRLAHPEEPEVAMAQRLQHGEAHSAPELKPELLVT